MLRDLGLAVLEESLKEAGYRDNMLLEATPAATKLVDEAGVGIFELELSKKDSTVAFSAQEIDSLAEYSETSSRHSRSGCTAGHLLTTSLRTCQSQQTRGSRS